MEETTNDFMSKKETDEEQKLVTLDEAESGGISNTKVRDSFGKTVFGNNELCAQFLRRHTKIPQLKNVQAEDIEDVSSRFTHMFTEERDADVIKKIKVKDNEMPFYLISLIEHKSNVEYNVVMQILRYMVYIWEDYEKKENAEREGISKTKDFKYPPVLPIIYYDGVKDWTAALRLKERIHMNDLFAEYIPDYKCILFSIQKYSNWEIAEGNDELSVLMLIDKLKGISDFEKLKEEVPKEFLSEITENTPQSILDIMFSVIRVFLSKFKLTEEEIDNFIREIKEVKSVGGWFEHFEGFDLPAERKKMREELEKEIKQELEKEIKQELEKEIKQGFEKGLEKAKEEIREREVESYIKACKDMEISKEKVMEKVIIRFLLNLDEAESKVEQYW